MDPEFDAAGLDSASEFLPRRPKHGRPIGSPCANCSTPLAGPWCHACGQSSADFHRSAWHMVGEFFEGLFHFDSRVWRTLPDLAFRPARLSRRYVDGHRVPQVPPLRLFLITLLLLFLTGAMTIKAPTLGHLDAKSAAEVKAAREEAAAALHAAGEEAKQAIAEGGARSGPGAATARAAEKLGEAGHRLGTAAAAGQPEGLDAIRVELGGHRFPETEAWLRHRIHLAMENPSEYAHVLQEWSERFAFLMLPVAAILLSLLFVFQRRFWLYDHLVFAMHSLSFQGLLLVLVLLLGRLSGEHETDGPGILGALLLASPAHLFFHMRGFYGGGRALTLLRMTLLAIGSLFGFTLLLIGLLSLGLLELAG